MGTALIATLRESCGYLQDDGYHQTARLVAAAADEIEWLNRRVHTLESRSGPVELPRRQAASENARADRTSVDRRRHHGR
jgi:hypothetical protein